MLYGENKLLQWRGESELLDACSLNTQAVLMSWLSVRL